MSRSIKVVINDEIFNSIKEAAAFLEVNQMSLANKLRKKGECKINDFDVRFYKKVKVNKVKSSKPRNNNCEVLCTTTGQKFRTITEAAKACNVNSWTMSLKMEKAGKFIDKNNNEYVRLTPMRSKNLDIYPEQLPELTRVVSRVTREKVKDRIVAYTAKSEKDILKDVVKSFINNNKYEEASKLISILETL